MPDDLIRLNLPSKRDLCDLTLIVDRSGSMELLSADMARGIQNFITAQRAIRGECVATLTSFNSEVHTHFTAAPSTACPAVDLPARGGTALLDAVGSAIISTQQRLAAAKPEDLPQHVVLIIITDGWENASRMFVTEQIVQMIAHQTNVYGWQFLFIGTSSINGAKRLGIPPENASTWTPDVLGAVSLFERLTGATHHLRLTGTVKLLPESR